MKTLVHIRVTGFPGGLLQPVQALREHGDCYRLLESSDDPEHDIWEFTQGQTVHCQRQSFGAGESGMVAIALCTCK